MEKIYRNFAIAIQLLVLLFAMVSITSAASQPPEPPLVVKGEVELNEEPAPAGTQIKATLDGELIASSPVEKPGEYELHLLKKDNYKGLIITVAGIEYHPDSETIEKLNNADSTKATYIDISVEQPPIIIKGNVDVDGEPAPIGTEIIANLSGELIGNSTVENEDEYELHLLNKDDYEGITITVNDSVAPLDSEDIEKLNNSSPGATTYINLSAISGEPSAVRNLPNEVVVNEEFEVTIQTTGIKNGTVTETIPEGFKYNGSTLPSTEAVQNGNNVTFDFEDPCSFKYTLKAPMINSDTSETCKFNGTLNGDTEECPIVGDNELDVLRPEGMVLYSGSMNLVSVPYALSNSSVDHLFKDVEITGVSHWNASAGIWDDPSEVSKLKPLRAYQVVVPDDQGIQVIPETKFEPTQNLTPPPSMPVEADKTYAVGYTGIEDTRSIADTLNPSIENKYGIVTGPYINGTPDYSTDNYDTEIKKYYGYWVPINEDGVLHGFGYSMK